MKETDLHPLHLKLRYRKREFLCYLKSVMQKPNKDQLKVIIFAQGRTGSTLLESLLDSTGYFKKHMEILSTRVNEPLSPYRYLTGLLIKAYPQNFIFHLKIYHLTTDRIFKKDPGKFLHKLKNDGWKIIYLKRENKVKHVISNLVAEKRGSFEKHDGQNEKLKLTVDIGRFEKMLNQRLLYSRQEEEILGNIDHLQLIYEKDLEQSENQNKSVEKVLSYLNLPTQDKKISTSYKKVTKQPLSELIENFHELKDCLDKNKWTHYITDELTNSKA